VEEDEQLTRMAWWWASTSPSGFVLDISCWVSYIIGLLLLPHGLLRFASKHLSHDITSHVQRGELLLRNTLLAKCHDIIKAGSPRRTDCANTGQLEVLSEIIMRWKILNLRE
jgi:hypothetical protein